MPESVRTRAATLPSVRWVGTWLIVTSSLGLGATVVLLLGYFGLEAPLSGIAEITPWLTLLALAILVRLMPGAQSLGAGLAAAVVASVVAGPTLAQALGWLRSSIESSSAELRGPNNDDATASFAIYLVNGGLVLSIGASIMLVVAIVVPVSRIVRIPGSTIPKSPFRVEVLALIAVLAVVALALGNWDSLYWDSSGGLWTGLGVGIAVIGGPLAWIIPLSLVLALSLRSAGTASLWLAGGLFVAVLGEPLVRLGLGSLFRSVDGDDSLLWSSPAGVSIDRAFVSTGASAWIILPALVLVAVVLLWNARPSPVISPAGEPRLSAPIDPWAGVAFVLAFVPIASIPAILLGHVAYEGIVARGQMERGRIFAASAISIGILSVTVLILIPLGVIDSARDLVGW